MINQLISRSVDQVTNASPLWQRMLYSDFFIINFSNIIFGLWFFTSIAHIYYDGKIKNRDQEINRLDDELNHAKQSLEHESSLLLSRYSDLAKFKKNDILFEVMKRFTDKNSILHSAQIYKYTVKKHKEKTIIKVQFNSGYATEGIDINAIMQAYYELPNKDFEVISKVVNLHQSLENDTNKQVDEGDAQKIFEEIDRLAFPYMKSILKELKRKDVSTWNENDVILYSVLKMLIELLFVDDDENAKLIEQIFKFDEEKVNFEKLRRTGILDSILRQDYSIFKHQGASNKQGRVYISRCIEFENEQFALLLSLDPSVTDTPDFQKSLLELSSNLENMLRSAFIK